MPSTPASTASTGQAAEISVVTAGRPGDSRRGRGVEPAGEGRARPTTPRTPPATAMSSPTTTRPAPAHGEQGHRGREQHQPGGRHQRRRRARR